MANPTYLSHAERYELLKAERERIMQEIAEKRGKALAELKAWSDYDPILVDEKARYALGTGVRFAGD